MMSPNSAGPKTKFWERMRQQEHVECICCGDICAAELMLHGCAVILHLCMNCQSMIEKFGPNVMGMFAADFADVAWTDDLEDTE